MRVRDTWVRWLRFNGVGLIGVVVQLGVLTLLLGLRIPYLVATAIAVECAVLHNFVWHERYTWRDRIGSRAARLLRFHMANATVSLVGNILLMRLLAGEANLPPVVANLISIVVCSLLNFLLGDRVVFREESTLLT